MPTGITEKTEQVLDYRINRRYRMKAIRKAEEEAKLRNTIQETLKSIQNTQQNK